MFKEFLAQSRHLDWPLAAFVLFFLIFVGVIVYLIHGLAKKTSYDDVASLPLEEDVIGNDKEGASR